MDKVLIYTVYAAYMQCLVIGMGGVTDRTTIKVLTTLKVTGHTQDHTLSGFTHTHTAAVVLSRKDSKSRGKKSQSHKGVYLEHNVADKRQNNPQLLSFVRELSSTKSLTDFLSHVCHPAPLTILSK